MVVARILYKSKGGWSMMKNGHLYFCADSVDKIVEYASRNARGRELVVQPDYVEGSAGFASDVFNVETEADVKMVVDAKYVGPGAFEKGRAEWIFMDGGVK